MHVVLVALAGIRDPGSRGRECRVAIVDYLDCRLRNVADALNADGVGNDGAIGDIAGQDAEIWGISPDGSGSHAAFRAKFGLPFTLLSDEDHAVADAYGAWQEKQNYGRTYWGIQRSSFLVGPDGQIARAWPKVKADGHAAEVLEHLVRRTVT